MLGAGDDVLLPLLRADAAVAGAGGQDVSFIKFFLRPSSHILVITHSGGGF